MDRSENQLAPADLLPGARNAVNVCLAIGQNGMVVIITDRETEGAGISRDQRRIS